MHIYFITLVLIHVWSVSWIYKQKHGLYFTFYYASNQNVPKQYNILNF